MAPSITNTGMPTTRTTVAGAAVIVLLTLIAYLPVRYAGFVWDDQPLIIDNPLVHARDGLYRFWFTTGAADYYPLTSSLYWLEWRLWANHPLGYHLVNVFLHAANSVLLWLVLRQLLVPGAWFAGLVFAVHPVNVATVAWVSEQKNTLAMLFYAVAILLYLRFAREGYWRWYVLSWLTFLAALLSKTAVVMLPVVLLGCLWWQQRRLRAKDFIQTAPFFALALVLGLVTVWFQHVRVLAGHATRSDGLLGALALAGRAPWFYLAKALWPTGLTLIYPQWHLATTRLVSWLPALGLAGCLALFWWKRQTWGRPWLFALGYVLVALSPVLGFFDQSFYQYSLVADHWQYFALIGVIALAAAAGAQLHRGASHWQQPLLALAGGTLVAVLATATLRRVSVYQNNETLWQDNVTKTATAWIAHYNLGNALWRRGDFPAATAHYQEAVRLEPAFAEAHYNLGNALRQAGRIPEAISQYEQAIALARASGRTGLVRAIQPALESGRRKTIAPP